MPTLSSSTLQSSFLRLPRAFTPAHGRKKNKKTGTTKPIPNSIRDTAHNQTVEENTVANSEFIFIVKPITNPVLFDNIKVHRTSLETLTSTIHLVFKV